jgi:phosphoglycerol transferase
MLFWLSRMPLFFFIVAAILLFLTVKLSEYSSLSISKIVQLTAPRLKYYFSLLNERPLMVFALFLVIALIITARTADRRLKISDFLSIKDNPFVEQNFALLDVNSAKFSNNTKKNLILFFVESLEKGYADKSIYGANLLEPLLEETREGISFSGYMKTPGGYFTLDGISAQTLGMPVTQFPIDIHNIKNNKDFGVILGKAPGIFNLLKNAGYVTASFSGTSRYFTHKGDFLEAHGVSKTFFKEDWIDIGFPLDKENKGNWDFSDKFLMHRFKEYLAGMGTESEPFALIFETVDTHFPNGWAPPEYRVWNDTRDSFIYSSTLIADFLSWAKKQIWYKDTVIVIVGDHPWQDFANNFTESFTKKSTDRQIFTVVLNSGIKSNLVKECGYTPMDIAPTILNLMGISFKSKLKGDTISTTKIGLGTSLLSDDKNLVCTYGASKLINNLLSYSKFYDTLQ